MPSISSKIVAQLSADVRKQLQGEKEARDLLQADYFEPYYDYWWSLLECTNRPLLVYGIGSKKAQLQDFARHLGNQGRCASVVVRGESGGRIDDVIRELERLINVSTSTEEKRTYSTPIEARAHAIVEALEEGKAANVAPSFMILIHNFDTPLLMQERSLHTLSVLSASVRIHLCVDTCHVNSGLIAQMHSESEQSTLPWLWINMNTFVPMLEEIINERGTGISRAMGLPRVLDIRAAGGEVLGSDEDVTMMAERDYDRDDSTRLLSRRAAIQILRSVPPKGRNLFILLAEDFLKRKESATRPTMSYSDFALLGSRVFLNAEGLRSILVEFTTHGLIRIEGQEEGLGNAHEQSQGMVHARSGSVVSIALTKANLNRIYQEIR